MIVNLRTLPEFFHSIMPPRKVNVEDSTRRKHTLFDTIVPSFLAMRFCKNCSHARVFCRIGDGSEKCVECVSTGRTCDLVISPTIIKRIQRERRRIRDEVRKARAAAKTTIVEMNRLKRQLEALKDQEEELISTEWQNIVELKADEQAVAIVSFLDLFFDVAFEQFQLLVDFDWSSVSLSGLDGIVAEGAGSSQSSR